MATNEKDAADASVAPIFGEKTQSKKAMFSFAANEAKRAGPLQIRAALRDEIRKAFRDEKLFAVLEDYLLQPGMAGASRHFNHAFAVATLLEWDAKENKRRIASFGFTPEELWYLGMDKVLRRVYEVRGGFITGLLEHKPGTATPNGDSAEEEAPAAQ